ncbi:MAG: Fe-S cluster assembly protein HesB [Methanomicrobiales archaeon]|nr:Fe-S cluster assembly protein HesB [Methanomicrobiales archaeon]
MPWWRGTADEIMIGAILTQQTRWENVGRAISELKSRGFGHMEALYRADQGVIEDLIRCTGFYRVKAKRLKALAECVQRLGGIGAMDSMSTSRLREELLHVKGIGEETADSILCYAFSRPVFVIDDYTRKICTCAGVMTKNSELRRLFGEVLPEEPGVCQQAHAHMVEYAKERCVKGLCEGCRIRSLNG